MFPEIGITFTESETVRLVHSLAGEEDSWTLNSALQQILPNEMLAEKLYETRHPKSGESFHNTAFRGLGESRPKAIESLAPLPDGGVIFLTEIANNGDTSDVSYLEITDKVSRGSTTVSLGPNEDPRLQALSTLVNDVNRFLKEVGVSPDGFSFARLQEANRELTDKTIVALRREMSRFGFDEDRISAGVKGMIAWAVRERDQSIPPNPEHIKVHTIWSEDDVTKILEKDGVVEGIDAYVWRIYGVSTGEKSAPRMGGAIED